MDTVLRLQVNGQERELVAPRSGATVLDLLASLDQHPKTVAVELNRELVPRARFGETELRDGDRVEIVRFVQGGSGVVGDAAFRYSPALPSAPEGPAALETVRRRGR